ncbi:MAG: InlB B-repeat-containing protein [Lachnospiraceae bacterium]|nr:InlB B-repeat-containing protein [Lachnospiraceae bacterium]
MRKVSGSTTRRRITAFLLLILLVFGELGGTGMRVYAAGDEEDGAAAEEAQDVLQEDEAESVGCEGAGDLELMGEEVLGDEAPYVLLVNGSGRGEALFDGDSFGTYASYRDGVLTLKGYSVTDNAGGIVTLDNNSKQYKGIFSNKDLIIELDGVNRMDLGLSGDVYSMYGIQVLGDLTIRNASGKSGSLTVDMSGAGGSGKAGFVHGIYALGNITFEEQSGGSFEILVNGAIAKMSVTGEGYSYGVQSQNGNTTVKGGAIELNMKSGENRTYGFRQAEYYQNGGTVVVRPVSAATSSADRCYGLYSSEDVVLADGSLSLKANNVMGTGVSVGLAGEKNVTLGSDLTAEGGSTAGGISCGVYVFKNTCFLKLMGNATLKGDDYPLLTINIDEELVTFQKPVNATIKEAMIDPLNKLPYLSVFGPDGNVSKEVITVATSGYGLWIGANRIDDGNKANLPFLANSSYDPASHTLTLKGNATIGTSHSPHPGEYAMIYALDDLNIVVEGSPTLTMDWDTVDGAQYGIYVKGDLSIANASGKDGHLTLDLYHDGKNRQTDGPAAAIYSAGELSIGEKSGGKLELKLYANTAGGSQGYSYGIKAGGAAEIEGGTVRIFSFPGSFSYGLKTEAAYLQSGGKLLIEPFDDGLGNSTNGRAVECNGIAVSGGKLEVKSSKAYNSYGIWSKGSMVFGGDAEIDAASNPMGMNGVGINGEFDCDGSKTIRIGGKLHASGKLAAVRTMDMSAGDGPAPDVKPAIFLFNEARLLNPAGGEVDHLGGNKNSGFRCIADSAGTPAKEVLTGFTTTYEVAFDLNGQGGSMASQFVEAGGLATEPDPTPTAEGFTFKGWYTEAACTNLYDFGTAVNGDLTLYAGWEEATPVKYTVSFVMNGRGTQVEPQEVAAGGQATEPDPAPSVEGFTFTGWYREAACTNLYDFSTAVNGNLTLYAGWEEVAPVKYTVSFVMNGHGTQVQAQEVAAGGHATEPDPAPAAEGFTFTGWYLDAACTNLYDFSTDVNGDLTLYAGWEAEGPVNYTVSFVMNGHGDQVGPQEVAAGGHATEPDPAPAAEGYAFGGWYREAACTIAYDFGTAVTGNITLYAKWTKYLTVSFDLNGHGTEIGEQKILSGETVSKPNDPVADGYKFGGWYREAACTNPFLFNSPLTDDVTIYAKWTKYLTVSFDANGHGTAPAEQKLLPGEKAAQPDPLTATGYRFGGWYKEAACTTPYSFNDQVTEDITLYAKWTQVLAVNFDANGHGTAPEAQQILKGEKASDPGELSVAGYAFGGWYTEEECRHLYDFDEPVTESITLYAKWTKYLIVSFDANGHGTAPASQQLLPGEHALRPAMESVTGYILLGWYTEEACEHEFDFAETAITEDITLYAKWEDESKVEFFTVSFEANGHGTAPGEQKVAKDKPAGQPEDPEAEGFVFGGWFTEEDCVNLYDFETPVTADLALYAKWTELFTVRFEMNGHGTAPEEQKIEKGKMAQRPQEDPSEGEDCIFGGWFTEKDCVNEYDFNAEVTADVTLYAKWTEYYYVRFEANGHGIMPKEQRIEKGQKAESPKEAPEADDYVFGGWFTEKDCVNEYDFDAEVTADVTLYAKWTELYSVHFEANGHGKAPADQKVEKGKTAEVPEAPTDEEWIFGGWYTDADCTKAYDFSTKVTDHLVLYAKWTEKNKTEFFTVHFVSNGHGTAPKDQEIEKGGVVSRPKDPTAMGYRFTGWFTEAACLTKYDFSKPVEAELYLYAGWVKEEKKEEKSSFVVCFAETADDPWEGLYYDAPLGEYRIIYTGEKIMPAIRVIGKDGTVLREGIDYSVKYSNNLKAGKNGKRAVVLISGKGNYSGKKKLEFMIEPADLGEAKTRGLLVQPDQILVKAGKKVAPVVLYRNMYLSSKDYKPSVAKFSADGVLNLSGKGNFSGELTDIPVKVLGGDTVENRIVISFNPGKHVYDGKEQILSKEELSVQDADGEVAATEYIVRYSSNIKAGTAKVTITGCGSHSGSFTKTFRIEADTASTITPQIDEHAVYSPKGAKPAVKLTVERDGVTETLREGVDYRLSFSNNKKAGTGNYTVSFLGNYKGRAALKGSFTIDKASLAEAEITIADMAYTKAGKYRATPYVRLNGELLGKKDYLVRYYIGETELAAGDKITLGEDETAKEIRVKLVGTGSCEGESAFASYRVMRLPADNSVIDLSKARIVDKTSGKSLGKMDYSGSELVPEITVQVKVGKEWKDVKELIPGENPYSVICYDNTEKGKATLLIIGNGSTSIGCKSVRFGIKARKLDSFAEED